MAQFFLNPDVVAPMDAVTRSRIMAQLPEFQRRKRRAAKLRGQQASLEAMRDKERDLGGQSAPVTRGLTGTSRAAFDPIGSYIPNYSGMAEKLVGGIGGYLMDKKADTAEDEYNSQRNQEVIDALGQYGSGKRPENFSTDRQLRGYLGLMGEDVKELGVSGDRKVRSTQKLENGNLGLVYDDGIEDTGQKYDYAIKTIEDAGGDVQAVGLSGGGRGQFTPVTPAGAAPPGVPGGPAPTEEGPNIVVPGDRATGAPAMGIEGLPPEAQKEMQTTIASMQALGMPQETIDDYVGRAVAKAQATPGMQQQPTQVQSVEGMAPPAPAPAPAPAPVAPPAPATLRVLTPGEKKAQEIAAQNAAAPETATAEGMKQEATQTADQRVAARENLAKAQDTLDAVELHVNNVLSSPVLDKLVGKSWSGRISAIPGVGNTINDFLLGAAQTAGPEGADLNAQINQLTDEAFLASYTDALKGTGQVATVEGLKTAQAKLRSARSQSPEAFRSAMKEFLDVFRKSVNRLHSLAGTPAGPTVAPAAPAAPALPSGWSVKVK